MNRSRHVLSPMIIAIFLICTACGGAGGTGSTSITSTSPAAKGREIVERYLKNDSAPYRKERLRFTITESGVPQKLYELDNYRKQAGDESITYTVFVLPAEDAGLGSLTFESKAKKTVVVTYSESRGEFRETDTSKTFFGGLTAGELLGEWDKFDYTFLSEKDVAGAKTHEVEGKLKPGESSVIARIVTLFRTDDLVPVEMHLFASSGKEIRTYRTTEFKTSGEHSYAARIEVDNHVHGTHVTIEKFNVEFPEKLDDAMFVRDKLKRGGPR